MRSFNFDRIAKEKERSPRERLVATIDDLKTRITTARIGGSPDDVPDLQEALALAEAELVDLDAQK